MFTSDKCNDTRVKYRNFKSLRISASKRRKKREKTKEKEKNKSPTVRAACAIDTFSLERAESPF